MGAGILICDVLKKNTTSDNSNFQYAMVIDNNDTLRDIVIVLVYKIFAKMIKFICYD